MKIPLTMRYIEVIENGQSNVMQIVKGPIPKLNFTDVLIRVAAAGVSRGDIQQRQGKYPPPPGANPILGLDISGEIVAKGSNVSTFTQATTISLY